jgi:DNA-binding ferritin-like protein
MKEYKTMAKINSALAKKELSGDLYTPRPIFILENQLMDTLELQWHVQQAHIRLNAMNEAKVDALFEGLTGELRGFTDTIRKRLQSLRREGSHYVEWSSSSFWRLFAVDDVKSFSQFEALVYGYAHYAKQTSKAILSLERLGDVESSNLLREISRVTDRCLRFVEIYMEGCALNCDISHLPDWPVNPLNPSSNE